MKCTTEANGKPLGGKRVIGKFGVTNQNGSRPRRHPLHETRASLSGDHMFGSQIRHQPVCEDRNACPQFRPTASDEVSRSDNADA